MWYVVMQVPLVTWSFLVATNVDLPPGFEVNSQLVRNIQAGLNGGLKAEEKMKKLVDAFTAIEGNKVCYLHNEKKVIIGAIMQTKAQAQVFRMWPETLAMDWTYNTNNLGYNLGTSVSVSFVLLWICLLTFVW